ncbi:bacteriohemerythrin [uncultured Helicobacter sp.]|uniref:bacteriohemerythrin n=1 Tax=uncultured Helicobacter sp. TaxID=175537 RepID=UPI001C3A4088|nr:bacteriohemerythrin [Candidatus Helicobacter avicola]
MLPEWSSEYSVHNQTIDAEHRKLFELAHRVEAAANKATNRSEVKEILAEFFNYMRVHFAHEEEYMKSIGYPELPNHKEIHKEFTRNVASLVKNSHSINDLKENLLIIARDWLIGHIMQEDKRIEEWNAAQLAVNVSKTLESGPTCSLDNPSCKLKDKPITYVYQCHCKIHKVSESTHNKINKIDSNVVCKECKYPLQFLRQE